MERSRRCSLTERLEELRALAVGHLMEMRQLLANLENVHKVRAVIAERVGVFTLWPSTESGKWSYTAKGSMDFFGLTTRRADGAGGQNRTLQPTIPLCIALAA
jgi:hypothetical protein